MFSTYDALVLETGGSRGVDYEHLHDRVSNVQLRYCSDSVAAHKRRRSALTTDLLHGYSEAVARISLFP